MFRVFETGQALATFRPLCLQAGMCFLSWTMALQRCSSLSVITSFIPGAASFSNGMTWKNSSTNPGTKASIFGAQKRTLSKEQWFLLRSSTQSMSLAEGPVVMSLTIAFSASVAVAVCVALLAKAQITRMETKSVSFILLIILQRSSSALKHFLSKDPVLFWKPCSLEQSDIPHLSYFQKNFQDSQRFHPSPTLSAPFQPFLHFKK